MFHTYTVTHPSAIQNFLHSAEPGKDWPALIENGHVQVGTRFIGKNFLLRTGDIVRISEPEPFAEPPVDAGWTILHEDPVLCAVNKPAHLPVHPCGAWRNNCLTGLLKKSGRNWHLLNRLDNETSGVMVCAADTGQVNACLAAFLNGQKTYIAGVYGIFPPRLFIEMNLGTRTGSLVRKRKGNNPREGKYSATSFKRMCTGSRSSETGSSKHVSIVLAHPKTGRMHQIRAHLSENGFPVIGDKIYGPDETFFIDFITHGLTSALQEKLEISRQFLHCAKVVMQHPLTGKKIIFRAPLPEELSAYIQLI